MLPCSNCCSVIVLSPPASGLSGQPTRWRTDSFCSQSIPKPPCNGCGHGVAVGVSVGAVVGVSVGAAVGVLVAVGRGIAVGALVGGRVGLAGGAAVVEGCSVGCPVGMGTAVRLGARVGGISVGSGERSVVGEAGDVAVATFPTVPPP